MTRSQIRLARPSDAKEIAALSRDTIEAGLPWCWVESRVLRCVNDPDHNVVVAEAPNEHGGASRFTGFGIMQFLDEHAHLSLLAVAPAMQGQGVGGEVLAWLIRCAEVAGAATVKLELKSNNVRARRFYERAQFCEIEFRAEAYYGLADQCVMARRLRELQVQTQ
jgi:[ribosomal protein S18]-alanine N-acetyltransferase